MKLSAKARSAAVAVLAAAALGGGLATAPAASAAPSNCWTRTDGSGISAWCNSGSGYYQAYGTCYRSLFPAYYTFVQGPWQRAGSGKESRAWCPLFASPISRGVGLRN